MPSSCRAAVAKSSQAALVSACAMPVMTAEVDIRTGHWRVTEYLMTSNASVLWAAWLRYIVLMAISEKNNYYLEGMIKITLLITMDALFGCTLIFSEHNNFYGLSLKQPIEIGL
jgi:hypothetical protein